MKIGTRAEVALAIRILRAVQLRDGPLDIEIHGIARRLEDIAAALTEDGPPVLPPGTVEAAGMDGRTSTPPDSLAFSD